MIAATAVATQLSTIITLFYMYTPPDRVLYRCRVWSLPGIAGERWLRHRLFGIPLHQCHQVVCANMYTPQVSAAMCGRPESEYGRLSGPIHLN